MSEFKPGLYQHYKGNYYNAIGICRHSETLEIMVVYQALYGDYRLWVRPLDLFLSTIDLDGQTKPRFEFKESLYNQPPNLR